MLRKICVGLFLYVLFSGAGTVVRAQWVSMNIPGPGGIAVHGLLAEGNYLFAGTAGNGALLSTDSGATWTIVNNGLTDMSIRCFADSGGYLFAGGDGDGVFVSQDSGVSWTIASTNLFNTTVHALLEYNGVLFAGTDEGAFYSTDNGGNWLQSTSGLITARVNAFAISNNTNLSKIYAGTDTNGLFLSVDDSDAWTATSVYNGMQINCVVANLPTMYAGTTNGIWISSDGGAHWAQSNAGLTDSIVYALAQYGNILVAGTRSRGIFRSVNGGASWLAVDSGLTDTSIFSFAVVGKYLYAGGNSNVWRGVFPDALNGVKEANNRYQPGDFSLDQNYPNPFSGTTTISYFLPESELAILKVYDEIGKEIATLVDGTIQAGTHTVTLHGDNLPSGLYVFRLTAGKFSKSGEMTLIR